MQTGKLALLPLLRQINALELRKSQLVFIYPLAVVACIVSAFKHRESEQKTLRSRTPMVPR
jgi:hypothetical protein